MNITAQAMQHVCGKWAAAARSNVIPFPTPSERQQRESRKWMRTYTREIPHNPPPSAA